MTSPANTNMDVICLTCHVNVNESMDSGVFPDATRGNVKIVDCHGACKMYGSAPPSPATNWVCVYAECKSLTYIPCTMDCKNLIALVAEY